MNPGALAEFPGFVTRGFNLGIRHGLPTTRTLDETKILIKSAPCDAVCRTKARI